MGGLVAAAELRKRGFSVTIFEAGNKVAGLYGKLQTPFGTQEMGMHVLYLTDEHSAHLENIFGADAFHTWSGPAVDLASHRNFGQNFFSTVYPDLRALSNVEEIRREVLSGNAKTYEPANALEAVVGRFGKEAGNNVYAPILQKLWKTNAEFLTPDAIHCFYDLRRVALWDKEAADLIKNDPWFDGVVANPDQNQPHSVVFANRTAARFKNHIEDSSGRANSWLEESGVRIELGKPAKIFDRRLWVDGVPLSDNFQACIIATPIPTMIPGVMHSLDLLELSIYYFQLREPLGKDFPAYYLLVHENNLLSSRVVNYDAYIPKEDTQEYSVISVEVVHRPNSRPLTDVIAAEVKELFPMVGIIDSYLLPATLKVPVPSLKNSQMLEEATLGMENYFSHEALFFAGMRTDKGIFFSHHTIGLAYDSALDCSRRLT